MTAAPARRRRSMITAVPVLLALLAVTLTGCAATATGPVITPPTAPRVTTELTKADAEAWLDGMLPSALEREGLAGATVSVVSDGRILTERGYGAADLGEGERPPVPVDPAGTLFRIGSVSKLITAVSVMQQVEAGKLDLDADVQTYLDFELERAFDEPVTLRHLLSHTAGYENRARGVLLAPGTPEPDLRTEVAVDQPDQLYRPGTVPAYSNWSNALAAYVVQRVTGMTYRDYARERVLDRLGMTGSSLEQPLPEGLAGRMSQGYPVVGAPAAGFETVGPAPAGGMSATGHDLGLFMLGLLGTPAGNSPALLRPESLATMGRPAVPGSLGGLGLADQMGIGFYLYELQGHRVLAHGGDTATFHSQLAVLPEQGTGIFVSINSTGRAADSTAALRTALMTGFVERYHPGPAAATPAATATSAEHAARVAGTYQLSRRAENSFLRAASVISAIPVINNGDGTISLPIVATTGGHPLRLREVTATEDGWVWQEIGGEFRLAMDVVDGQVTAIGYDPAHVLLPLPPDRQAVLPVAVAAIGWALLVLLAWPIGAIIRRRHGVSLAEWSVARRRLRTITHLGLLAVPLAVLGWFAVISLIGSFVPAPEPVLRALQVLTVVPALAAVPALLQVIGTIRNRGGVWNVIGNLMIMLALLAFGWVAWTAGLLTLDLTY
ncbi:serine hydrolase domain-containing protein [Microlunatus sp. GCM10028923]|uniref:serine hydrolase domain-containing protein n=1 Tax=Microlunatus sp. GCM10028923 TaxID=3273400 RepID=UPI003621582A